MKDNTAERPKTASDAYDEERIPFDLVLRKLVSAPPAHKAAKGATKAPSSAKKPAKRA